MNDRLLAPLFARGILIAVLALAPISVTTETPQA